MRHNRGFTVVELSLACALFSLLMVVMMVALRQVSGLWQRSDSKDEAARHLLKAREALSRDLANASGQTSQCARTSVGPNLGMGRDGDALTFLSTDAGQSQDSWSTSPDGSPVYASQILYYLVIPASSNPNSVPVAAGPPDINGYEQQSPYKWLIRRVEPAPAGNPPVLDSTWSSWLTRPTSSSLPANQRVVSNQLLGFRVLRCDSVFTLELSAVAVKVARAKMALGNTPLSQGSYTLVQRFSVKAGN